MSDLNEAASSLRERKATYKYVWLNLNTGEFSDSFVLDQKEVNRLCQFAKNEPLWKLIKFECVNDPDFEFTGLMRIN
jgi:hypothetical protein